LDLERIRLEFLSVSVDLCPSHAKQESFNNLRFPRHWRQCGILRPCRFWWTGSSDGSLACEVISNANAELAGRSAETVAPIESIQLPHGRNRPRLPRESKSPALGCRTTSLDHKKNRKPLAGTGSDTVLLFAPDRSGPAMLAAAALLTGRARLADRRRPSSTSDTANTCEK
jgi:hypothetical protein